MSKQVFVSSWTAEVHTVNKSSLPPIYVNKSPKTGVQKEEKLDSNKHFANWEMQVLVETKSVLHGDNMKACFYRGSSCPSPWVVHLYANEKYTFAQSDWSKYHCPDWSKSDILIVVMERLWLVNKDTNEDIVVQFWLDGAGLSSLVERLFQGLLCKGRLRWQEHSAGGWQFSLWLSPEMPNVWEAPVSNGGYTLIMNLSPINHKESFLAGVLFWGINNTVVLAFISYVTSD